jgi:two-component system chemotaxis sensor kinase CheA
VSSSSDIHQRVLAAFRLEFREQIAAIRMLMEAWPLAEGPLFDEAFRMAHSMKGGARVCDLLDVEHLAHDLESLLSEVAKGHVPADAAAKERMGRIIDEVDDLMIAERSGSTGSGTDAIMTPAELMVNQEPEMAVHSEAESGDRLPVAKKTLPTGGGGHDSLRIHAGHLDRLLQSSGQLVAEASRQEALGRELEELFEQTESLRQSSDRSTAGPGELHAGLVALSKQLQRVRLQQQQAGWSLRMLGERQLEEVRHIGMVPINTVFEGFPKMMRDLAAETGKKVEFTINGGELQADRAVLQSLKDPVMHALRNAMAHGIESPSRRRAAGKDETGRVRLEIEVIGQVLRLSVLDDGQGVDLSSVRAQALRNRLVTPEVAENLDDSQWLDFLFEPRFSTTAEVTRVSGRGVGLSVVKDRATQLQGTARMLQSPGGGCQLIVEVPVSVSTHRLLLVRTAGRTFALGMRGLDSLHRVTKVHTVEGRSVIMHGGRPVPLVTLGPACGLPPSLVRHEDGHLLVAVLKGDRPLALNVEEFVGETSALIKALPHPASLSPHFSGAILLEGGEVALVINLPGLMQRFLGATLREEKPVVTVKKKPVVLVVDDSFTARTLQKSILEAAGYAVRVAVNGKAAYDLLRTEPVDAVVSDVQMPEMDGFQLLSAMKNHVRLAELPVVLVTSLSSREDQERGLALGADAYIVKERFDHRELLDTVRQLV